MPIMPIEHHKQSLELIAKAKREEDQQKNAAALTDSFAGQLETKIRNAQALHGKLGEALVIALHVPGIYDHELRVMRNALTEQIVSLRRELQDL